MSHERRATSYKLQATSYKPQFTIYKLQLTSYKLQVTGRRARRAAAARGGGAVAHRLARRGAAIVLRDGPVRMPHAGESRVTSSLLDTLQVCLLVISYKLQPTSHKLQATSYKLQVTSYKEAEARGFIDSTEDGTDL